MAEPAAASGSVPDIAFAREPASSSAATPLVIGHRGAPGYRPEHTRASYMLALAMGVDAIEPDVVVSRDGVLVVRHENEISATTDVASHPEFASRRRTARVDGTVVTGWFAEDFTWQELSTLRCRERLPQLRRGNRVYDGQEPILRLRDVLDLVATAPAVRGRPIGMVLEIKHPTFFADAGWNMAAMVAEELNAAGWAKGEHPLVIESFEASVLDAVRTFGVVAQYVYLLEATGTPYDLVRSRGGSADDYAHFVEPSGLAEIAGRVDGISVDKTMLLGNEKRAAAIVAGAHAAGLVVFTWTARPENTFLTRRFQSNASAAAFGDYEGEWAVLRDAGVDGVFVDHADLGVAFFGAQ